MKKRILLSLLCLFILFSIGSLTAGLYITNTTQTLSRLVTLHQIETLRKNLIQNIQTVQSDLYTAHTSLGNKLDVITDDFQFLLTAAKKCSECHHEPAIAQRIDKVISSLNDYQDALSYYLTASARKEIIDQYRNNAAGIGNSILSLTTEMSLEASSRLSDITGVAMQKIGRARWILAITLLITFIIGSFIAARLVLSITRPVTHLVEATRKITSGNLGHTITIPGRDEFGELAARFNEMILALRTSYHELEDEIAERERTSKALKLSEERYALAAQGANDGLWDWDIDANTVYYSPRWKAILGYDENDMGNSPEEWFSRIHPDDRNKVEAAIASHTRGDSPFIRSEYRMAHRDGNYLWVLTRGTAVTDRNGKAYRIAGSQTDISARKKAEEQLLHDAFHDALTGLPNRALFIDRLTQAMRSFGVHARRGHPYLYAVLFIDLDRFKVINDSLGHRIGDQLLIAVGRRLVNCLRPSDTVARLGGDEFAIILETEGGRKDISEISERIQKSLPEPFLVEGHEIVTTASIGITFGNGAYGHAEEVIRDSDIAMYQAKTRGKARTVIFDEQMHAGFIEKLQLESDLRMALERNELRLHYQPIIDLSTNSLKGFEALVRWYHPVRGLILPMDFIPMAEEAGLILSIGEWILREACCQLVAWQEKFPHSPPLKMSLNISGKQFSNPVLFEQIAGVVNETGADPASLVIEITESIIMENAELALSTMKKLRDIGIQIFIDDFGTGYSSLSYINVFPVNALKIDRSFVNRMGHSEESMQIIKAIIVMAQHLNLEVIAEGLEVFEQVEIIRDLACRYAQGYYFSRPMDRGDIERWLMEAKIKSLAETS